MAVKIGKKDIVFIKRGNEVLQPDPVRDGLVLWYDFMGRKNTDAKRGIAGDLSGNGNHGTLQNFAFSGGSGYEDKREIDGRNLYAHSKGVYLYPAYSTFIESNSSYIKFSLNREKALNIALSLNSFHAIQKPNTTYVMSGTMHINEKPIKKGDFTRFNTSSYVIDKSVTINDDGSFVLIFDTTETLYHYQFHMQLINASIGDEIKIYKLKIEEGSVATPWRPAMEDPEYNEWANDKGFKRGLAFDGVDDGVFKESIFHEGSLTAQVTVKVYPGSASYAPFLRLNSIHENNRGVFFFGMSNSNSVWAGTNGKSGVVQATSLANVEPNIFYVLHCVLDDAKKDLSVYVNGLHVSTISHDIITLSYTSLLQIGSQRDNVGRRMKGTFLSSLLYNRALTPEEIAHNYAMEKERWNL